MYSFTLPYRKKQMFQQDEGNRQAVLIGSAGFAGNGDRTELHFLFNSRSNPLNFIYGTVVILVLANMVHFYSVPFVTASSALKKLDREYENVADSMKIPQWKTFLRVTVPLSLPAILEIFLYYFMNSMVTVSAVVFLYSAKFKIASIAITHMEEAGDIAQAAAMSLLILAVNITARGLYEFLVYRIRKKNQARETGELPQREYAPEQKFRQAAFARK